MEFFTGPMGSFDNACNITSTIPCQMLGKMQRECVAISVDISGFQVNNIATTIASFIAFVTAVAISAKLQKRIAAVGHREFSISFLMYALTVLIELILYAGFLDGYPSANSYLYCFYFGFLAMTYWCFMIAGFSGFQIVLDGTWQSLSLMLGTALIPGAFGALVAADTSFNVLGGVFSVTSTFALFALYFLLPSLLVLIYLFTQIVVCARICYSFKPLQYLVVAFVFFSVGQVCLLVLNQWECQAFVNYADGITLNALFTCIGLSVLAYYFTVITEDGFEEGIDAYYDQYSSKYDPEDPPRYDRY